MKKGLTISACFLAFFGKKIAKNGRKKVDLFSNFCNFLTRRNFQNRREHPRRFMKCSFQRCIARPNRFIGLAATTVGTWAFFDLYHLITRDRVNVGPSFDMILNALNELYPTVYRPRQLSETHCRPQLGGCNRSHYFHTAC